LQPTDREPYIGLSCAPEINRGLMSEKETNSCVHPELLAEMEETARVAMSNVRDPEVMRQACERMDRLREENLERFGVQSVTVDLIRDIRDLPPPKRRDQGSPRANLNSIRKPLINKE